MLVLDLRCLDLASQKRSTFPPPKLILQYHKEKFNVFMSKLILCCLFFFKKKVFIYEE